jgi:malate dehydrogenase
VGVPVVLGAKGVERVIELKLDPEEQAAFTNSVNAVKALVKSMNELVAKG